MNNLNEQLRINTKKYEGKVLCANLGHILPKCTSKSGNHDMEESEYYGERTAICKTCGITWKVDSTG